MTQKDALKLRKDEEVVQATDQEVHVFKKGFVCDTDTRGHATPGNLSPHELVVDASEGFIPLWDQGMTLRWRFNETSMSAFADPDAAKTEVRTLLGEAILAWGSAAPVKFAERSDAYDFEIVVRAQESCTPNGCVLASAFFPDPGRHILTVYPTMFDQPRNEQVETLIHEIGHIFGLRHFFADVRETTFPVEIFGVHERFSIMNYGSDSVLTDNDKADLTRLYEMVWSGELTNINGTPVQFMRPFHTLGASPENAMTRSPFLLAPQPVLRARYMTGR